MTELRPDLPARITPATLSDVGKLVERLRDMNPVEFDLLCADWRGEWVLRFVLCWLDALSDTQAIENKDTALVVDDDRCVCGWQRPVMVDFDGVDRSLLPEEFEFVYQCPVCGLGWRAGMEKTDDVIEAPRQGEN